MRILTVDPGVTTGIAYATFPLTEIPESEMPRGFYDCSRLLHHLFKDNFFDLVICEKFTINAATIKKSVQGSHEAIQLIGVTRYLAQQYGIKYEEQKPVDAKNFVSDEKLRRLGWYVSGPDHARDALRHLVLAAVRHKVIDLSSLIH